MTPATSIPHALDAIGRGEIAVVVDDEDRENEGDLVLAAAAATPDRVSFLLQHTSGVICVGLSPERVDALALRQMVDDNREAQGTAFTVSVDAAKDVTTGISASDRAVTIQMLSETVYGAADFVRPGHIFPLRARAGGVLKRAGHTEAAVDLARMSGAGEGGALCEVVTPDKRAMARAPELRRLARDHGLPLVTIADLVRYRLRTERLVELVAEGRIPTRYGEFTCQAWRDSTDDSEHVALVHGDVDTPEPVLVRVHSECLTGDVFGSLRCDCGSQFSDALAAIGQAGRGVVVYLRGHEGRGIGITHKLRAYTLQDAGRDTVDANLELGLPVDSREYGIGAQILRELGVRRMRLMTNNPAKYHGLSGYGLEIVERRPLPPRPNTENIAYLEAKRRRMGHLLPEGLRETI
jgi:3,4-dihydroxy 2-butanone 4-phosphate synthase / GTP cyclohydrolase II